MIQAPLLLGKTGLSKFVAGLLTGVFSSKFINPSTRLPAHLTTLQCGTFTLAEEIFSLKTGVGRVRGTYLASALVLSCYVLGGRLIAPVAIEATKIVQDLAGVDFEGRSGQELIDTFLVLASAVLMLLISTVILACSQLA